MPKVRLAVFLHVTVLRTQILGKVNKEKEIELPDELLRNYLTDSELDEFKNNRIGIFSITVTANK